MDYSTKELPESVLRYLDFKDRQEAGTLTAEEKSKHDRPIDPNIVEKILENFEVASEHKKDVLQPVSRNQESFQQKVEKKRERIDTASNSITRI